jgi:hypothetical protein
MLTESIGSKQSATASSNSIVYNLLVHLDIDHEDTRDMPSNDDDLSIMGRRSMVLYVRDSYSSKLIEK